MKSLIIVGQDSKPNYELIEREFPELEITYNSLPTMNDGVAVYDCGKFKQWDWPTEVALTGTCIDTHRKEFKTLQGDPTSAIIQWLHEGQLVQPPEEAVEGILKEPS